MNTVKQPTVEWWVDKDWMYIRLVNTPYSHFHEILNKFKRRLDYDMEWQPDEKAWRLPLKHMQQVALFANELFGAQSMRPCQDSSMPYQHRLL